VAANIAETQSEAVAAAPNFFADELDCADWQTARK